MPEYLVESYHPTARARPGDPGPSDVADAAARLTRDGRPVSLVRAILVPDDETCLYLLEADEPDAALDSVAQPGLSVLRVLASVSVWSRPSGSGPAPVSDADRPSRGGPPLRP